MSLKAIFLASLSFVSTAFADAVGYGGVHSAAFDRGTISVKHTHDWSSPKVSKLFLDLPNHQKFFAADNDFAFIEVARDGKVLFRSPSPALTLLWVSPDGQIVVGLSDIMLYNPFQLVVWSIDGHLLHSEHISDSVALYETAQQLEFTRLHPLAAKFLAGRVFSHQGHTYLDYSILGVPSEIGDAAWDYLYALDRRHPYSDDFASSVTNSVRWFDSKKPGLKLTRKDQTFALTLRSPGGKEFTIHFTP